MSSIAAAGLPLAAVVIAILAAWAAGFDHRSALPPGLSASFYGFFLDRYPLFAAAIVYGLARLVVAATAPGPSGTIRRAVGLGIGAVLLLGLSLYPTFGGLVLRGAFATGGMAFLNQQPMIVAYGLGAATAAFLFAIALGLGGLAAGAERGPRGFRSIAVATIIGFLFLWFAFAVLGIAREAGFGNWPRGPLRSGDAFVAIGLALVAFLPHALLVAFRRSRQFGHTERLVSA
ncbi:MAG: hypothetical protein K2Y56_13455 [Methylobacterium sp.]|uniref:hypothetical protein n=1 Tax=Methylobacterium sp. TaxID=409 RepID=UPI0025D383D1|nr:hypothetical protein [Methylobacterium sp.]MBX9932526.1 hypothetical protein [Methylobacterium sp.]